MLLEMPERTCVSGTNVRVFASKTPTEDHDPCEPDELGALGVATRDDGQTRSLLDHRPGAVAVGGDDGGADRLEGERTVRARQDGVEGALELHLHDLAVVVEGQEARVAGAFLRRNRERADTDQLVAAGGARRTGPGWSPARAAAIASSASPTTMSGDGTTHGTPP